ncbi:MAG: hypothetical protein ABWK01_06480 [Infirmifilum sp.]
MSTEGKHVYYISLLRRKSTWEILYNIGGEGKDMTVLRLNGKHADKIFRDLVRVLARQGAVTPVRVSDREEVYAMRDDVGPVVGGFLILFRKSGSFRGWGAILDELFDRGYIGLAKAFISFLELAMDLSRAMPKKGRGYTLSPVVLDALAPAARCFIKRLSQTYKRSEEETQR